MSNQLTIPQYPCHLITLNLNWNWAEGFVHRRVKSPWNSSHRCQLHVLPFVVLMLGLARAVMTIFLAIIWKTEIGMSTMEIAIAGAIFGMALEIVVFFVAKYISPIMGNYWMLRLRSWQMVVRCWAYFFMPKSHEYFWLVYLIELLKVSPLVWHIRQPSKLPMRSAPEGLEATAQALYNSVYVQLPTIIAGLVECGRSINSRNRPSNHVLWDGGDFNCRPRPSSSSNTQSKAKSNSSSGRDDRASFHLLYLYCIYIFLLLLLLFINSLFFKNKIK